MDRNLSSLRPFVWGCFREALAQSWGTAPNPGLLPGDMSCRELGCALPCAEWAHPLHSWNPVRGLRAGALGSRGTLEGSGRFSGPNEVSGLGED